MLLLPVLVAFLHLESSSHFTVDAVVSTVGEGVNVRVGGSDSRPKVFPPQPHVDIMHYEGDINIDSPSHNWNSKPKNKKKTTTMKNKKKRKRKKNIFQVSPPSAMDLDRLVLSPSDLEKRLRHRSRQRPTPPPFERAEQGDVEDIRGKEGDFVKSPGFSSQKNEKSRQKYGSTSIWQGFSRLRDDEFEAETEREAELRRNKTSGLLSDLERRLGGWHPNRRRRSEKEEDFGNLNHIPGFSSSEEKLLEEYDYYESTSIWQGLLDQDDDEFDTETDEEEEKEEEDRRRNGTTSKKSTTGVQRHQFDIVTKLLRIVESQAMQGSNCTPGTDLNLGDKVVNRYAQERFQEAAMVAVNWANWLTRMWKYAPDVIGQSEYLLHASMFSMIEMNQVSNFLSVGHNMLVYPMYSTLYIRKENVCELTKHLSQIEINVRDRKLLPIQAAAALYISSSTWNLFTAK